MDKEEAIAIQFEGGIYLQRLEPLTAMGSPLTTSERLIVHLEAELQKAKKRLATQATQMTGIMTICSGIPEARERVEDLIMNYKL